MKPPPDDQIHWAAWAAGIFGVVLSTRPDGSIELRYDGEVAIAATLEQADAYFRFWRAQRAMREAGCVGPPQKVDSAEPQPAFRLEPTRSSPQRRQLRLFPARS
jgi:hypothetical protein